MRLNENINKVFGIGLPRTGTRSLTEILISNGVNAAHFSSHVSKDVTKLLYEGNYNHPVIKVYEGITNAFEMVYPQIDKNYPNSKFIYTTRNKDIWLKSMESHFNYHINKGSKLDEIHHHLITFGCYYFNKDRFSYVYDTHKLLINDFFKDRPEDLLTVDITTDKQCVKKICYFLQIPMKSKHWHHTNTDEIETLASHKPKNIKNENSNNYRY